MSQNIIDIIALVKRYGTHTLEEVIKELCFQLRKAISENFKGFP
jgi:hypothetical protein